MWQWMMCKCGLVLCFCQVYQTWPSRRQLKSYLEKIDTFRERRRCSTPATTNWCFLLQDEKKKRAHSMCSKGRYAKTWSFRRSEYKATRNVIMTEQCMFITLEDDLYGTGASDNQVKTLSARKADNNGHRADVICDALFWVTLGIRFRRRG